MEKTADMVIEVFMNIINSEYNSNSIIELLMVFEDNREYIERHTSVELYERLYTEIECCSEEYECEYGVGEYSERIYKDCIDVIKEVMQNLGYN